MTASDLIPLWPVFESDEIGAVVKVLQSGRVNFWTGTTCRDFEVEWSRAHAAGAPAALHSLCMGNGSLTLDAALRALDIHPGDEVIVSPRSYVASAMCVMIAGATPVFADVDLESGCITPETAEAVRSPRTRAVIPVHIGGWPCDMHGFAAWAGRHGVHVIEDCAQSHGGHIEGRALGTFGTFASWSFCQDKIMTTGGEGGMLCTADADLFRSCWSYAQHGKDHDEALTPHDPAVPGTFRWLVRHEGTNLRMTEMQAAIGLRQLAKLPTWSAARRRNSEIMQRALQGMPGLRVPTTPRGHAHYRCTVFTEGDRALARRNALLVELSNAGLPAMQGACPEVYLERAFQRRGYAPGIVRRGALDSDGRLPNARRLGETSLAFPVHHTIDAETMERLAQAVRSCVEKVSEQKRLADAQLHS